MKKIKTFQIDTKIGGGTLVIFEKAKGGYIAEFNGMSGLAHVKKYGSERPSSVNVDFRFDDATYDKLIERCRAEIERCDSEIQSFSPIKD